MIDLIFTAVLDDPARTDEFEIFVGKYERIMFSVAFGVLKDHYDAEDAVIDAMVGIAKNFSYVCSLDENVKKAYACRCAKNRAINIYNTREKRYKEEIPVDEFRDDMVFESAFDKVCEDTDVAKLRDAIMMLNDVYRDVLYMYFAEKKSARDIALELGIKYKTVQARITRGKKELIRLVKEVKKVE